LPDIAYPEIANHKKMTPLPDAHKIFTNPKTPDFPNRVTLELTNHCNLSCSMCPRKYMKGPKGYLSFSLFKKAVDEISDHNGSALVPFFRGESLLHPGCVNMLAYAKKKNIGPIQFTTNGTIMNENIARNLIDLEIDFISFSVDSIDPRAYGEIRKGADLNVVLKNIDFFCNLKKEGKLSKPEVQVSVVKTNDTSRGVDDFIRFWENRVDRVRVYKEHSQDGEFGSLAKSEKENLSESRQPCLKPFTDIVIYWNGSVALCNHDWDRADALGSLNDNSISEIWHGDPYEKVREAHLGREKLESVCENCDHWKAYYCEEKLIGDLYVSNADV
jgi:radical SAM protein with 4Fe4S-binding SPASM domain